MKSFEDLESLLYPGSIAVVGATNNPLRAGARIIENTKRVGFAGKIFPVNPKYDELFGYRCYPALSDIPEPIDNAWIVLPNEAVLPALQEAEDKGAKVATVYSSGWGEIGEAGRQRERELREWLSEHRIRLLGPNTIGMGNTYSKVVSGFNSAMSFFSFRRHGDIGFVSQSGAMVGGMVGRAEERGIEIGYYVHTGNEIDIDLIDVIEFMVRDEKIRVILGYVEGIRDADKFIRVAGLARASGKPLIFYKTGISDKGKTAVASHTGAISGSDRIYGAVFKQYGITRVSNHEELFEVGSLFSRFSKSRPVKSGKVLVFTPSGGAASIFADKCDEAGIELARMGPETKKELAKVLPSYTVPANPLDIGGGVFSDPSIAAKCLDAVCGDPEVEIVTWTLVGPPRNPLTAKMIEDFIGVSGKHNKPTAVHTLAGHLNDEGFKIFRETNFPTFDSIESCVGAIRRYLSYRAFAERVPSASCAPPQGVGPSSPPGEEAVDILDRARGEFLPEHASKRILSAYGIRVPRGGLAKTEEEAVAIAERVRYPVVLKVSSADIPHKTEAGTVALAIGDAHSLKDGYRKVLGNARAFRPDAGIDGVLVEEMAPEGVETIVGMSRDPQFGPAVLFGLGGIFVELLGDVSIRVVPFDGKEAERMVQEIKGRELLNGFRKKRRTDLVAVADAIMKVQRMSRELGARIEEIDINPLVVYPEGKGVMALDALIRRQRGRTLEPQST